jgi:peptide/nickel transport system substrate-binding protein
MNPNNFTEATFGGPQTLDPAIDYETAGGNVLQNVYETLLWYQGNTTTLIPWLATVIPTVANGGISPDGLNYTFTIKSGVKFQDNSTMNAGDVVFSIQRALRMSDFSGPAWMIQQILDDYIAYFMGDTVANYLAQSNNAPWIHNYLVAQPGGLAHVITQDDVNAVAALAVTKVGTNQVRFHLTHAYPGFLAITAYTVTDVLSQNFTKTHDLNETCLGTGPYSFVSWEHGASIHLKAWSNYWGTKAKLADVYILDILDVNTRLLMLQNGSADYISLPIGNAGSVIGNPLYFEDRSPTLSVAFFVFNYWINSATANSQYGGIGITDDFFQNVHMRLAFEYLFNASLYIQSVAQGNALPLNGVIPKGLQGYNASTPTYSYDLAKAAAEMKLVQNPNHPGESWYKTGFTIPLFYNTGNAGRQTACMLLQSALGALHAADPTHSGVMGATVNGLDWGSEYLPTEGTPHNFMPMYLIGWSPDYADPDDYTFPMLHTGGTFPIGSSYDNSTINQMVINAGTELDMAKRTLMYQDMMTLVHEDPPYIFIDQPNNFLVFRAWVTGEYSNPMYSDMYYAALSKNTPPVPLFQVTPSTGDTSTLFSFDASASHDAEESSSVLTVQWDWNGDGTWDTTPSTNKVATHTFTTAGDYDVSVNVIDTGGLNATVNHTVIVTLPIPEFGGSMALVVAAAMALMVAISWKGRRN